MATVEKQSATAHELILSQGLIYLRQEVGTSKGFERATESPDGYRVAYQGVASRLAYMYRL